MNAIKALQDHLKENLPFSRCNVELASLVHDVWLEGFRDGMAMYEHGLKTFGAAKLRRMKKGQLK